MITDRLARRVTRVGRRPVWLRVIVALVAASAIVLTWAPVARAQQADATIHDLYQDEPPPGQFNPVVYGIYYEVTPLVSRENCGFRGSWLIPGGVGAFNAARDNMNCTEFSLQGVADMFFGMSTENAFEVTRVASVFGVWVTERAYSFDLAEWMVAPAKEISARLQSRFVERISLGNFLLFIAVFYSGYHILKRRTVLGLRELVVSLLVAVIGGTLIAERPGWVLETALPHAIAMSGAMLELSSDNPGEATGATVVRPLGPNPTAVLPIVRPLTSQLHDAMIGQPYDLINWGTILEGGCASARDRILTKVAEDLGVLDFVARGPAIAQQGGRAWIDAERGAEAREEMRSAGCEWSANFNEKATGGRLMMAILSGVIAMIVTLMLILIAIAIIGAQFVLAQMLAIAPLAFVVGTVPGAGRELLAKWLGVVVQALAAVVVMSFVLTLYLQLTTTILNVDNGVSGGYYERFFLLLIAVIMVFRGRKKLLAMAEQILERTAERLVQREEGRSSADWGGLLDPGNMLRFGAGTLLAQKALQVGPGIVGRLFRSARRSREASGRGTGGGLPGGLIPAGALPAGVLPAGRGRPAGPTRPATPAARRSFALRRRLMQGARMIPGVGRAAVIGGARAAAGFGRGAGRFAKGIPRGVGSLPARGLRGTVIGTAGAFAAGRAGINVARRTPRAIGYGTVVGGKAVGHGTVAATKAVGHGTVTATKAVGHGAAVATKAVGHGAAAATKATGKAAKWTGREASEGYWQAMGRPYSPTADKLIRYATQPSPKGKHRPRRSGDGGTGT